MTTTNEALILTENFDSKPTETTQHGDSVDEFPFTVSSSTDTASEGFQEESYEHSNKMGRLPQKTINEEEQSEVHIPLHIPKPRNPEYQTEVLQQWEGIVETVGNESFTSRLRDLTNKEYYPREIAELPIEDISDDDQELLQEGAVFYLTVGRSIHFSGRQQRFGHIVFRRLPGWTPSTLRRAEKRAERLSRFLDSKD